MYIEAFQPVGAQIHEFDLRQAQVDHAAVFQELLAEHGVLIFREQSVTDADLLSFLNLLGPLTFTTGERPVVGHPKLNIVTNVGRRGTAKSRFHIDSSYFAKPPAYTALRAVVIPPTGGETLFTNQYWAYEQLSTTVKERLANRSFSHVVSGLDLSNFSDAETEAKHLAFKPHPISGKVALYMSTPLRCTSVSGLADDEARELIAHCYEHSIQEQNIYRHHWQAGDIVIWDNGCTLHRADHSRVDGDRILHRGLSLGYNA